MSKVKGRQKFILANEETIESCSTSLSFRCDWMGSIEYRRREEGMDMMHERMSVARLYFFYCSA